MVVDDRENAMLCVTQYRVKVVGFGLALVLALTGCAATDSTDKTTQSQANSDRIVLAEADAGHHQIDGSDQEMTLHASQAFFEYAPVVVVLGDTDDETASGPHAAAEHARELGIPLLLAPDDEQHVADFDVELQRLGARTVMVYGTVPEGLAKQLETIQAPVSESELPEVEAAETTEDTDFAVVVRSSEQDDEAVAAALTTAQAAGATLHTMASADPRAAQNQEFFEQHDEARLYAIGDGFAPSQEFSALAATAATGTQLPGGGQIVFPDRRMVALYGTPGTAALGLLGEQGIDESIDRAKTQAKQYQPYSDQPVQPAFEIITTVASASAGQDGTYSNYTSVAELEPWVQAAQQAGVYVILDFQPGRNDFLTQVQHYEKLLTYSNVGVGYDPEWRLQPGQRHMEQIGSVDAAELNQANEWLAELTREHKLPQKVVIVHQFQLSMIQNRSMLDTSHPELSIVLHADGNGTPEMKMETWNALRQDLPEGINMAWKNFIDEDSPTFSPEQTYDIEPKPWFVSYQ